MNEEYFEAQRAENRRLSRIAEKFHMRDEGDLFEVREPTMVEGCRALAILTLCAWAIIGLMGAGVWWLFNA